MKGSVNKILRNLSPSEKRKFFLLTAGVFIINLLDIFFLAMLLFIVNPYTSANRTITPEWMPAWLFSKSNVAPILIFFILFSLKNIIAYFVFRAQYAFSYGIASRISYDLLLNYLEENFSAYVHTDSSVHIRKISQQPVEFSQYILAGFQQIISESILIAFSSLAIFLYSSKLFALLFVIMLPALLVVAIITKKKLQTARTNVKSNAEKALQYLQESLSGYVESNVYDKHSFFLGRYSGRQKTLNARIAELQSVQLIPTRLLEVFAVCGLCILILASQLLPQYFQATTFITIGAFMAAAYKIIPGVVKIANAGGQIKTYSFVLDDLLLAAEQRAPQKTSGRINKINSVIFEHVGCMYGENKVVEDFNLEISSGDFVGISAPSGKGKTSVINMLLGFTEPSSGNIFFNEERTTSIMRKKYWPQIAYAKQHPFLLHDTLLNNITLGELKPDEQKIPLLMDVCGLNGLQTVITENGKNLSGGQRQRIAMARALYKNANLLLLDEPFSELDNFSSQRILSYLNQLSKNGTTVLLISHNPENFIYCSNIFSLHAQTV